MEELFCVSQYFVNKQNVRSYGNIARHNSVNNDLLSLLTISCETPYHPISVLLVEEILLNLKRKAKNDFKPYFDEYLNTLKYMAPADQKIIAACCMKAMYEIIPKNFYGNNHNSKLFKKLIQSSVHSMKGECVMLAKNLEKWNFDVSPWNLLLNYKGQKLLISIIKWILKNILSPMICLNFYVTSCKLCSDDYKLYYFHKSHWQKYYDTQIYKLMTSRIVVKSLQYSCGRKLRKHVNWSVRQQLKSVQKSIPTLHFILKPSNEYRPIARYRTSPSITEKKKIKERLNFLKLLTGKPQIKLQNAYLNFYNKWLVMGRPQLYFVKADLSNAFGSVNNENLMKILRERHMFLQRKTTDIALKKKFAQQFRDLLIAMKTPLLIRAGSTVFEWKKGLLQGHKYSPALSELYYSYLDEKYFKTLITTPQSAIKFFTRSVDDYMFISESLDEACGFLAALSNYENVNYEKTVANFNHPDIKFSTEVTFLGYTYDTKTLQVSRATNVYSGQMCYKIAFTDAILDLDMFLQNRIGQSSIHISGHIFNLFFNSEELLWHHIFVTLCLSANKFCSILARVGFENPTKYLVLYKKLVSVKFCNAIIETILYNKKKDTCFMFCVNHFRYISWKALYLCSKGTIGCSNFIPLIKVELAKTNCIFGKWWEHASRIDKKGVVINTAVREVCRRTDLRKIMYGFDALPDHFQCYGRNKLL